MEAGERLIGTWGARASGSVEAAAANEGVSVNTWLVRALQRAVSVGGGGGGFHRSGKRISGFSQA